MFYKGKKRGDGVYLLAVSRGGKALTRRHLSCCYLITFQCLLPPVCEREGARCFRLSVKAGVHAATDGKQIQGKIDAGADKRRIRRSTLSRAEG